VLLLLIIILAILGGFLGTLLKVAFWFIVILALAGALLGFFLHRLFAGSRGSDL
jgi:hypothetical protein